MAYERHLRDVLALHKPRNDFDVAATASTAGVVSANTGPFSRLRSAAGPAIRLQMSAARALLESHCMARTCTICSHPKLVNIDRQLLRGDMLNGIAHRFHVSPDAVGRHRRHMRTAMLKAQAAAEKQDLVYGPGDSRLCRTSPVGLWRSVRALACAFVRCRRKSPCQQRSIGLTFQGLRQKTDYGLKRCDTGARCLSWASRSIRRKNFFQVSESQSAPSSSWNFLIRSSITLSMTSPRRARIL